jgi:murein DD-endopeptidase MepM/ murein hydrolase activator NlpD
MDDAIATPLLLGALASGGLLLWSATRRQRSSSPPPSPTSSRPMTPPSSTPLPAALPSQWLWPVPPWRDYRPEVSSPWGTPRRRLDGTKRTHLGVDIMYRRRSAADQHVTFPPSTANGSADFFMPDDVPALAVDVGTVTWSKAGARGHAVVLRHAGGWRTFYQHLERPRVKVGDQVLPGQVLGLVGGDPTQKPPLKHLHFEVCAATAKNTPSTLSP